MTILPVVSDENIYIKFKKARHQIKYSFGVGITLRVLIFVLVSSSFK